MDEIELNDIYHIDSVDVVKNKNEDIKVQKSGVLLEVQINGQKFHTIDPLEFAKLENVIRDLKQKLALTENAVRQLQLQLNRRDSTIKSIQRELDNKVSHET